jgi:deoxycytidylate deaminase
MNTTNHANEFIIGIIAPTGIDKHTIVSKIDFGCRRFSYKTIHIKVSRDIIPLFSGIHEFTSEFDRIRSSMDTGNFVREKTKDNSFLMKAVINSIYNARLNNQKEGNDNPLSSEKNIYIIDSIKNPDEVALLRSVYGTGFHLLGISSSKIKRIEQLKSRTMSESDARSLIERDEDEENQHGQKTRDAFQECDYFIDADSNADEVKHDIDRLLHLLFGDPFITPTFDEYAMFIAYSASLRSADLSRQIGAVIAKNNEIISMGANDCPKAFGGLYWPKRDNTGRIADEVGGRDYTLGYDSNKIEQKNIIVDILSSIELEDNIRALLEQKLKSSTISNLTEFGRVVHAEMEAISACARNTISCKDATLYSTTFPCHNCAKHIISSGIKKVVFIEPYPKSKAFEFYRNEISETTQENKVWFTPFIGVGPHRFIDLFAIKTQYGYLKTRKNEDGTKYAWDENNAKLRYSMPVTTFFDYELFISAEYLDKIDYLKELK